MRRGGVFMIGNQRRTNSNNPESREGPSIAAPSKPHGLAHAVAVWIRAMRAPFFTATVASVLVGAAVAARDLDAAGVAGIDLLLLALALVGAIAAHAGTNLANDYGDHLGGTDEINEAPGRFNGGSRVIQSGLLTPRSVLAAAAIAFGVCIVCGLAINRSIAGAWYAPTPLMWLGAIGVSLGVAYTLGPLRLSYEGLGEVAIAIGFGPVMVLGAHYVLTATRLDHWHWTGPALASLPVAVMTMLIVWINQFQDAPADAASAKRNWVVRLAGPRLDYRRPFRWYVAFNVAAFTLVGVLALPPLADGPGTPWAAIAMLPAVLLVRTIPAAHRWVTATAAGTTDWRRRSRALEPVNAATIGMHLGVSALLASSYVIDLLVTGPGS
ncbi:MAG: prenyltransferase [Proteobacteria bacterium]|nr:MAG: prenyltransferase [Pseudomonadota bacterium]